MGANDERAPTGGGGVSCGGRLRRRDAGWPCPGRVVPHCLFVVDGGRRKRPHDHNNPAIDAGALVTASVFDGSLTFSVGDPSTAVPFEPDPPVPELSMERAEWGQQLEPDQPYAWALYTHCGIGQLGEFNGKVWQLDDPRQPVPAHLRNSRQKIYG